MNELKQLKQATITFEGPKSSSVTFKIKDIKENGQLHYNVNKSEITADENEMMDGGIHLVLSEIFEDLIQSLRISIEETRPENLLMGPGGEA